MLSRFTHQYRVPALMLSLVLVVLLAACGGNNSATNSDNSNSASNTSTQNQSETAISAEESQTRTVKHAMGETTINGTPQKVVVLTNEGTEAVLALGVTPVGAVKSWTGNPWYEHISNQMSSVTVVGDENQPNIELIAGLQPDLILGNKMRQEAVYEQLSAIAPTVFAEDLRGDWQVNFNLYAEALNKTTEGEQAIAAFEQKIDDFKTKAGDKLNETISVVRFMDGKTRVYHVNTFSGVIFDKIGIARNEMTNNVPADTFVDEITKERLPEVEASRLFYFTYETGDGNASKTEEEWTSDPLWTNLTAVKNNRAYKVSDAIWNTAGGILAANILVDELKEIYEIN